MVWRSSIAGLGTSGGEQGQKDRQSPTSRPTVLHGRFAPRGLRPSCIRLLPVGSRNGGAGHHCFQLTMLHDPCRVRDRSTLMNHDMKFCPSVGGVGKGLPTRQQFKCRDSDCSSPTPYIHRDRTCSLGIFRPLGAHRPSGLCAVRLGCRAHSFTARVPHSTGSRRFRTDAQTFEAPGPGKV